MNGRHGVPKLMAWVVTLAVICPAGGAAPTGDSVADALRFEVTGSVTPSCALRANRIRIDLGAVAVSGLPSVGDGSRWVGAAFIGTDCVGATGATVTLRAMAAVEDPRYIATTGEARGVAIEMRTGTGQAVIPDGVTPVRFDVAGDLPELRFEARYVRVGPLMPGNAPGAALVQITWE